MSNKELYEEIGAQLKAGRPVVQATVIQTKGSTPRKEGSTMLVRQDGSLVGTIGGGCGEAGVIQKARLSLLDGKVREELADLTEEISTDSEAVCGGTLRVFIEPWMPSPESIALALRLTELAEGGQRVVMHQIVKTPGHEGPLARRAVVDSAGDPILSQLPRDLALPETPLRKPNQLKRIEGYEVYSECWDPTPTLVIVGAGHIAEPLEQFARVSGFHTAVVDDRSLFANRERFPLAHQVICGPILEVCQRIDLSPHHYFVLVTRGHTLDMDALRVLIDRGETLAYVGMIGSRRRVNAVFELLAVEGYGRELFTHVRSPVGLNIGAETPAEIAVSVMAEVIAVRRGIDGDTRPLTAISGLHPSLRRAKAEGIKQQVSGE